MSSSGIWLVTDVRTEARHLANLAAYRANLDTGTWIARAICRTLNLPEPILASETDDPESEAAEADMVSALKEMGERLDRPRERDTVAPASNSPAPIEELPDKTDSGAETQPDDGNDPPADAPPPIDRLAPLPASLLAADTPASSLHKSRLRPVLMALAATVLIFAAPLAYFASSDLGNLRSRAQSSGGEFIQNLLAIAQSVQSQPEIRPATAPEPSSPAQSNAAPPKSVQPAPPVRTARATEPTRRTQPAQSQDPGPLPALRLAATSGDRRSQFELGMRYAAGQGLARDTRLAALWLHRAAAQGSADAQYNLAAIYATADGQSKNFKKAFVLYKRAADRGHPRALHNLGIAHAVGQGTAVNLTQAQRLLEASVRKGVAMASYNLGVFNEFGLSTAPDPVTAMQWYRHATENGAPFGTDRLGELSSIVGSGGTVPSQQRIAEGQALLRPLPPDPFPAAPAVVKRAPAEN